MALSEPRKREIVGTSRTLFERIQSKDSLCEGRSKSDADKVIEEWRKKFPDDSSFQERLNHTGLSVDDYKEAVNRTKLKPNSEIPAWVNELDRIERHLREIDEKKITDFDGSKFRANPDRPPFVKFSTGIAKYVEKQIEGTIVPGTLSENAINEMLRWFRRRFYSRFVRILFVEFKTYVASNDKALAFSDPEDFDQFPTDYFEDFQSFLFREGFSKICYEYPIFARLLMTQIRQWRDHLVEFCERLQADRDRLENAFQDETPLGNVDHVEPLADDTHGDGRAVMKVAFSSGINAVYKPRSVDAAIAFYEFLEDANDILSVPDFKLPTYVRGDNYGWMEWIEHQSCKNDLEISRYYQRVGALICVGYLLELTDIHFENFVAMREHPLLLDAETIFHPYFSPNRQPTENGLSKMVDNSALLTLLLPFNVEQTHRPASEMPAKIAGIGLSSDPVEYEDIEVPRIVAQNTDVMDIVHKHIKIDRGENIPKVSGEDRAPEQYLDEIISGFRSTYESAIETSWELEDTNLSERFGGIENRIVYRPTREYASLIRRLSSRKCLRDGVWFGIEMEDLVVPFCTERIGDPPLNLYAAERQALKRFDPPRFTSYTDQRELYINKNNVGERATESGLSRSLERISSISHSDMMSQIEIIRGSFGRQPSEKGDITEGSEISGLKDEEIRQEVEEIFNTLQSSALTSGEGAHHWTSLAPWQEVSRLSLQSSTNSLYTGRCGIALFSAGLHAVFGDERYRQFTLDTLKPAREMLNKGWDDPAVDTHGGAIGVGSVIYSLSTVGNLINEPKLIAEAELASERITQDMIRQDTSYDVINGSSGTILGILGTHSNTNHSGMISKAVDCGDHLIQNRTSTKDGTKVWKTMPSAPPLTGFAHGVSGIVYALIRLSNITGHERFKDAAVEALEYERKAYSPSEKNWRDYRSESGREFLDQWCHGRTGIGLAHLGSMKTTDDAAITAGYEQAVSEVPSKKISRYDHLCCGNAGRAEFLLEAAKMDGQRQGDARTLLSSVVDRADRNGCYQTLSESRHHTNPTFFHGLSGIGYSLLRLLEPENLPCVLLWE